MTIPRPAGRGGFRCGAYDLVIRSEIALPELPEAGGACDFEIRLAPPAAVDSRSIEWREEPAEAVFDYPQLARFTVRAGRELVITPDPRGDPTIFHLYVQGMMLAAAVYQRGRFVLHASVVEVGDQAIAFTGVVGAGKSTFATAFLALGHRILADDNAAIDLEGESARVLPAFPNLKIYPEVARSLGVDAGALRPMHASQVKQAHAVGGGFSAAPLPLAGIYVLDRAAEGGPRRLPAIASVTELIRHSVPTRWGVAGSASHLRMCARLARLVPLYRVGTFRDLSQIRDIAGEVERHAAGQTNPLVHHPAGAGRV
jgi:hypothetical protein